MFYNDRDIEASWIGKPPDWYDDEELEGKIHEYDEDFEYESRRDMEMENELR